MGRLLHAFVRTNEHLVAYGGGDGSRVVNTGLEVARLFPDFQSVSLHATESARDSTDAAAGSNTQVDPSD